MQEKSLLSWFAKRHESIVVRKSGEHAGRLVDASIELKNAMKLAFEGKQKSAREAILRLNASEREADVIEDQIAEEVSRAELEPKEREYLMRMIRHQDYAADWLKEAGLNLDIVLELDLPVTKTIWPQIINMADKLVECTRAVKRSIETLPKDSEATTQHVREVVRLEHLIDDLYFATRKELLRNVSDHKTIFALREVLHGMENSADSCKETADMIKMIIFSEK